MNISSKYEKGSPRWIFDYMGENLPEKLKYINTSGGEKNGFEVVVDYLDAKDMTFNRHAGGCVVIDKKFVSSSSNKYNFSGIIYLPDIEGFDLEGLLKEYGYDGGYEKNNIHVPGLLHISKNGPDVDYVKTFTVGDGFDDSIKYKAIEAIHNKEGIAKLIKDSKENHKYAENQKS